MFEVDLNRTFEAPVTVHSHSPEGKPISGKFRATYKIVPTTELTNVENEDKRLLDLVLKDVSGLTIRGEDKAELEDDELLEAAKADPEISMAMISTYNEKTARKNLKKT